MEKEINQSLLNGNGNVRYSGNNIYFFTEFNSESCIEFLVAFKSIEAIEIGEYNHIKSKEPNTNYIPTINIYINSYGGTVSDCMQMFDMVKSSLCKITTIVNGAAYSCGAIFSLVGDKRKMTKNSFMLHHQLSSGVIGTYSNIIDKAHNAIEVMKRIKVIIMENSKLDENSLDELLSRDLLLSPEECLKWGLIDEII